MKKYISNLTKLQITMIVCFILLLLANLSIGLSGTGVTRIGGGDDAAFYSYLQHSSLPAFLKQRYMTWSSRVVIESVLVIVTHLTIVWKILNTIMMFIVILIPYKFLLETEDETQNIQGFLFSISLFFLLPMQMFYETGWMATTANYLWVLAAGEVALVPTLKKLKTGQQVVSKWWYIIAVIALIYAVNQEQMVVIMILLLIGAIGILIVQRKSIKWESLQLGLTSISFIIILLAPGNKVRKIQEIQHWLPKFGELSLFRKIELGYSATLNHFFFNFDLLIFILLVMLLVIFWSKKDDLMTIFNNISLLLPLLLISAVIFHSGILENVYPGLNKLSNFVTPYGTNISLVHPKTWIPDLILLALSGSVVVGIFRTKRIKESLVITYLLICGVISRIIMGFSPTIWASGSRTFLFLYAAIICVILFIYSLITNSLIKRYINIIVLSMGMIGYLVFIIAI